MPTASRTERTEVPCVTSPGPQTRGFLFADLRGYSAFTERHGDQAAAELLGRYRELVRREIAAFHGAEIRTEGDSFYVVFDSVSEAVQAAVAIRDAAATDAGPHPIRVGIGIHAGETTDGEQGIVSSAVNVAARVCSQAEAGEVLVTDTVRSLTRTYMPVAFVARGNRRLKGISEPMRLFRVHTEQVAGGGAMRTTLRPMRRPAIAVGALGIAAIAVVMTMSGLGLVAWPSPSVSPSGGAAASTGGSAEPSSSSIFSVDPDRYTDAAAAAFLDRLPDEIADSCERADVDTRPVMISPLIGSFVVRDERGNLIREDRQIGPPVRLPLSASFGLTCLTNATRVEFWQATHTRDLPQAEELFFNKASRLLVPEGSCAGGGRAYETWESGTHSGHLMCYAVPEGSVLEWTYIEDNIYAIATRRDDDGASLYRWWREIGRLLSR